MMHGRIERTAGSVTIEMRGHANSPLVCAGISTMCCAVMSAIAEHIEPGAEYQPGDVRFRVEHPSARDVAALRVLAIGLDKLQEQFPGDLDVTRIGDWRL